MTAAASFVLPLDKPAGPTSHDVVALARRALGVRRIGHTGTLDPFASGLLLLCVGQATRIAEYLSDLPKTYHAHARLDGRTLTDDNTSELTEPSESWRELSSERVTTALQMQLGDTEQLPPQYSAKKIAGERAYDIARRGDVATVAPVPVHIYDIAIIKIELPDVEFEVTCSSGTYIRAIARDLGTQLGTGGYLTQLRRTSIGRLHVHAAIALRELSDAAKVEAAALAPVAALSHMEEVPVSEAEARAIRFGQSIEGSARGVDPVQLTRDGTLVAIAEPRGTQLRPLKVFPDA